MVQGMPERSHQSRIFYGWYIVAASFTMLFFNTGARYAFGVMFKPIIQEFGWSRGAVSLVFFLNMIIFAFGLLIVGKVYDRYGPKWVIAVSSLFLSVGFALTSFIQSIGHFFFSYGILTALGIAGTATPLISTITSKWFDRWRGMAVSLSISGGAVGQFALVPLLSLLTIGYGWRASYFYTGIVMLLVNTAIALFVLKGDPHQLGLEPLGWKGESGGGERKVARVSSVAGPDDLTLRQAMSTPSYWLFSAAMFICGGGDYFSTTHLIPMATDLGISPLTAGNMLGLYGLMSLAGLLVAGPAADRIGNKTPIILTFAMRFAMYIMIINYKSVASLYVFALVFGFTHVVTAPLIPMLMVKLYGGTHLGVLTGFVNTLHFLGGGLWAYGAGVIFDRSGNYQTAFWISAVAAIVAIACSSFIAERRHKAVTQENFFSERSHR
ncbi:MAG: MFS transporter [Desulfobacteraceae bacterium]|nr:MAG: MFS transporter [Desulfobacteraceae bacterium]